MSNGLVYIGRITLVAPIKNADRIERVEAFCNYGGTWSAVAQVGEFRVGDLCEVYLQDSLLPEADERFAFMAKHKHRVRMMRLRDVPSEALVLPRGPDMLGDVGDDITEERGVIKYERPLPTSVGGIALGSFPSFIPKTDEINFQKVPTLVAVMAEDWFYASEKADGTSCTMYHKDGHFGVCSRNLELKENEKNLLWRLTKKYAIDETLPQIGNVAIQCEAVGPGIQKNPMGLSEPDIRVFDIYNIDKYEYLDGPVVLELCKEHGWPTVPFELNGPGTRTSNDWRYMAKGKYPNGRQREGIVVRPLTETRIDGDRLSFKVLNLEYGQ